MKPKKKEDKSELKYSQHIQKLKNLLNTQGNLASGKEETSRLRVFTQV